MLHKRRHNVIYLGIVLVIMLALIVGCSSAKTTTSAPATTAAPTTAAPTTAAPTTAAPTTAAPTTAAPTTAAPTTAAPTTAAPTTAAPTTAAPTTTAAAKPIELRLAHAWATTHLMHKVIETWVGEVAKATDNRVKITIFPGGALSTAVQLYDTAATGIADLSWTLHGYTPGKWPLTSIVELPFMGNSNLSATRILYDLMAKYPQIEQEHTNVKLMYIFTVDPGQVMTANKPIRTLADIKGMKMRVGSSTTIPMAEALGAVGVLMNISDLYDSLQKGVVNGTMVGTSAIKTFNLSPVLRNMTIANIFTNTQCVIMNSVSWSKIPKQDQDIILKITGQRMGEIATNAYTAEADLAIEVAKTAKMDIYTLPDAELKRWRDTMSPLYQKWINEANAKGLPGQAVFDDALKLVDKYK